jgi:Coenzyme F390 synthetase
LAANHMLWNSLQTVRLLRRALASSRWPPEKLRDQQWRRLRRLLVHAYTNVPMYRELYDRHGFHPRDVRGLGDRAGTCIDPKTQIVDGKTVCVVSCQRSPEPVFLKWKGLETNPEGDLFVRSGPGTVKLGPNSAKEYIRTRFAGSTTREGSH